MKYEIDKGKSVDLLTVYGRGALNDKREKLYQSNSLFFFKFDFFSTYSTVRSRRFWSRIRSRTVAGFDLYTGKRQFPRQNPASATAAGTKSMRSRNYLAYSTLVINTRTRNSYVLTHNVVGRQPRIENRNTA